MTRSDVEAQPEGYGRHFVTSEGDRRLPLHLSTVGFSRSQGDVYREHGFPLFHWLHTVTGIGEFTIGERRMRLGPNQGILMKPNTPHQYRAETDGWATWFLTFDGALAGPIATALDIPLMEPIGWDELSPLASVHELYADKCRRSFDFAGTSGSLEVYSFLTQVKQYGKSSGQPSLSQGHERLTPLYLLIEERYGDPGLGLAAMAETISVSPQYLNTLFRQSWGMGPYQYLLQFRIQKAKDLLLAGRVGTVKETAARVGFLDDSHFVQTFRRLTGLTPAEFRARYSGL
ncbi:AraC family transcriptional regulator [Cohnella fermenti]|uniref:AraC family transcriptional regulator n=1 Tax=Cohnella fermenti TaxID=2565925 RepID=A0A4S4C888_9BACL|nr:AraC family transcriptional regulator [Cohnella fermenti]THF84174.1 AraC family transcriptional regulator [Cohnella fermenti]